MSKKAARQLPDKEFLDVPETAATLGISTTLVRKMIANGDLIARRFGRLLRVPRSAIDALAAPTKKVSRTAEKVTGKETR